MTIIQLGSMYAVRNRRGRIIFTAMTEKECHQYCQEVAAMPAFRVVD